MIITPIKAYSKACDQSCQKTKISNYFNYLSKVYQKGSTAQDIERLFDLFDAKVRYEHLEYKANFDLSTWRQAFQNNLKKGLYSASPKDGIRVENYIFGKRHVAVEYSYGQLTNDSKWQPKGDQKLFALFGFKGQKLVLVREYW